MKEIGNSQQPSYVQKSAIMFYIFGVLFFSAISFIAYSLEKNLFTGVSLENLTWEVKFFGWVNYVIAVAIIAYFARLSRISFAIYPTHLQHFYKIIPWNKVSKMLIKCRKMTEAETRDMTSKKPSEEVFLTELEVYLKSSIINVREVIIFILVLIALLMFIDVLFSLANQGTNAVTLSYMWNVISTFFTDYKKSSPLALALIPTVLFVLFLSFIVFIRLFFKPIPITLFAIPSVKIDLNTVIMPTISHYAVLNHIPIEYAESTEQDKMATLH